MSKPPRQPKIRLGDAVYHIKRPELGVGQVWELRYSGRVSVHWSGIGPADRDKRHYRMENLRLAKLASGLHFSHDHPTGSRA